MKKYTAKEVNELIAHMTVEELMLMQACVHFAGLARGNPGSRWSGEKGEGDLSSSDFVREQELQMSGLLSNAHDRMIAGGVN